MPDAHVFGLASWDSHFFVGTVAGSATAVVMELSDGTSQQCRLRRVEGAEAQYFIVHLAQGARPGAAVVTNGDGEQLAEHRFLHIGAIAAATDLRGTTASSGSHRMVLMSHKHR